MWEERSSGKSDYRIQRVNTDQEQGRSGAFPAVPLKYGNNIEHSKQYSYLLHTQQAASISYYAATFSFFA